MEEEFWSRPRSQVSAPTTDALGRERTGSLSASTDEPEPSFNRFNQNTSSASQPGCRSTVPGMHLSSAAKCGSRRSEREALTSDSAEDAYGFAPKKKTSVVGSVASSVITEPVEMAEQYPTPDAGAGSSFPANSEPGAEGTNQVERAFNFFEGLKFRSKSSNSKRTSQEMQRQRMDVRPDNPSMPGLVSARASHVDTAEQVKALQELGASHQVSARSTQMSGGMQSPKSESANLLALATRELTGNPMDVIQVVDANRKRDTSIGEDATVSLLDAQDVQSEDVRPEDQVVQRPGISFAGKQPSEDSDRRTSNKKHLERTTSGFTSVFDFKEDDTSAWRQRVQQFLESTPVLLITIILIFWALFGDDIRLAAFDYEDDYVFVGLTYFLIAAFSLEIVLLTLVKPRYFLSFYFWLDIIATGSLVLDLPEVNDAILNTDNDSAETTNLARATRTSRIGTRAGRVARVVRVVRLVRMLKVYKILSAQLARGKLRPRETQNHFEEDEQDGDANQQTSESRVGVRLTELTTRRVIAGVLIMLFVLPVFQTESGSGPELFEDSGLQLLHLANCSGADAESYNGMLETYNASVSHVVAGKQTGELIKLIVNGHTVYDTNESDSLRPVEKSEYSVDGGGCRESRAVINNKWNVQFESLLNICRTVFTCLILGFGALLFSRDANTLVLYPLERMVQKVKEMSENPLAKMQIRAVATKDEQQMETRILENSITKICSLLAVGFGDAGAEVVAENIRNGGDLNPMVPGHRMMAIFGFCDIRRFTDATEVLQEEVMEFVNSIAKIVHMEVSLHGGSANKNIGDAFLLVWKLPSQLLANADDLAVAAAELPKEKRDAVAYLADRALAAFVVIHVALKRSPRLKQFCMRSDIRKRMGDGYRVSMGFGLHIGWAIEGAIGSEYKIDASYLSPNVNMASRLEAATKQFGCSILMSDDFTTMLSPRVKRLCRAIDVITVKGSNKPVTLYTYDISLSAIAEPDENKFQDDNMENLSHSFLSFKSEFDENPDIISSIGSSQEFRNQFQRGFQAYIDGRWTEARDNLLPCLNRIDPSGESVTDGPTASLLEVMGRSDFIAPRDWKGVRHLTDK
uniref:Adenylyl cyclase n=1 Tax=Tetraselmis sp. GSL018 TaxID=582737 RepID=A0A061R4B8_9CHLO